MNRITRQNGYADFDINGDRCCISSDGMRFAFSRYRDRHGNPVEKDRHQWPYSYSDYVLWGGESKPQPGEHAVYSDRLYQWDSKKFDRCWKEHCEGFRWDNAHPEQILAFMRAYNEDPELRVTCLTEGCNVSSGYPYWVVFFHNGPEVERKAKAELEAYKARAEAERKSHV